MSGPYLCLYIVRDCNYACMNVWFPAVSERSVGNSLIMGDGSGVLSDRDCSLGGELVGDGVNKNRVKDGEAQWCIKITGMRNSGVF